MKTSAEAYPFLGSLEPGVATAGLWMETPCPTINAGVCDGATFESEPFGAAAAKGCESGLMNPAGSPCETFSTKPAFFKCACMQNRGLPLWDAAAKRCKGCPKGQYVGQDLTCVACPVGFQQTEDNFGGTVCAPCPAGEYGTSPGACSACPDKMYNAQPGQRQCLACPAGTIAESDRRTCNVQPDQFCLSADDQGVALLEGAAGATSFADVYWEACQMRSGLGGSNNHVQHFGGDVLGARYGRGGDAAQYSPTTVGVRLDVGASPDEIGWKSNTPFRPNSDDFSGGCDVDLGAHKASPTAQTQPCSEENSFFPTYQANRFKANKRAEVVASVLPSGLYVFKAMDSEHNGWGAGASFQLCDVGWLGSKNTRGCLADPVYPAMTVSAPSSVPGGQAVPTALFATGVLAPCPAGYFCPNWHTKVPCTGDLNTAIFCPVGSAWPLFADESQCPYPATAMVTDRAFPSPGRAVYTSRTEARPCTLGVLCTSCEAGSSPQRYKTTIVQPGVGQFTFAVVGKGFDARIYIEVLDAAGNWIDVSDSSSEKTVGKSATTTVKVTLSSGQVAVGAPEVGKIRVSYYFDGVETAPQGIPSAANAWPHSQVLEVELETKAIDSLLMYPYTMDEELRVGQTQTQSVYIWNIGEQDMTWTVTQVGPPQSWVTLLTKNGSSPVGNQQTQFQIFLNATRPSSATALTTQFKVVSSRDETAMVFVSLLVTVGPMSAKHSYATTVAGYKSGPSTFNNTMSLDAALLNQLPIIIHAVDMFGAPSNDVDKFQVALSGITGTSESVPIQAGDRIDGVTFANPEGLYKTFVTPKEIKNYDLTVRSTTGDKLQIGRAPFITLRSMEAQCGPTETLNALKSKCRCNAGFKRPTRASEQDAVQPCQQCEKNTYKDSVGDASTCRTCPANSVGVRPGATNATNCMCTSSKEYGFWALDVKTMQCVCSPGYISDCKKRCAEGEQPNLRKNGCEKCSEGQASKDGSLCIQCKPGSMPKAGTRASCVTCEANTYSQLGYTCRPCGENKVTLSDGATSPDQCVCATGKYKFCKTNTTECTCKKCPSGSYCKPGTDGVEAIAAMPGWWRAHRGSDEFSQCKRKARRSDSPATADLFIQCLGGPSSVCAPIFTFKGKGKYQKMLREWGNFPYAETDEEDRKARKIVCGPYLGAGSNNTELGPNELPKIVGFCENDLLKERKDFQSTVMRFYTDVFRGVTNETDIIQWSRRNNISFPEESVLTTYDQGSPLCAQCGPGAGSNGMVCSECPEKRQNVLIIGGMVLLVTIVIVLSVWMQIKKGYTAETNRHEVKRDVRRDQIKREVLIGVNLEQKSDTDGGRRPDFGVLNKGDRVMAKVCDCDGLCETKPCESAWDKHRPGTIMKYYDNGLAGHKHCCHKAKDGEDHKNNHYGHYAIRFDEPEFHAHMPMTLAKIKHNERTTGTFSGEVSDPKNILTGLIRIISSWTQVTTFVKNIDLEWPVEINEFFGAFESVAAPSMQFSSFDCAASGEMDGRTGGLYVAKFWAFMLLPVIVTFFASIVWGLWYFVKKHFCTHGKTKDAADHWKSAKKNFIITVIVLLFYMYTFVVKTILAVFACNDLLTKGKVGYAGDNGLYDFGLSVMDADLTMKCGQGDHIGLKWAGAVFLVLYGFGIPFSAFMILYKYHNAIKYQCVKPCAKCDLKWRHELCTCKIQELHDQQIMVHDNYGFLFMGFKATGFSPYWEVTVVFFRKLSLMAIVIALAKVAVEIQIVCAMMMLFLNLILHVWFEPYDAKVHDRIEFMSLMVSEVTLFLGLFFQFDDVVGKTGRLALTWIIVGINSGFIAYFGYYFALQLLLMCRKKKKPKSEKDRELDFEDMMQQLLDAAEKSQKTAAGMRKFADHAKTHGTANLITHTDEKGNTVKTESLHKASRARMKALPAGSHEKGVMQGHHHQKAWNGQEENRKDVTVKYVDAEREAKSRDDDLKRDTVRGGMVGSVGS